LVAATARTSELERELAAIAALLSGYGADVGFSERARAAIPYGVHVNGGPVKGTTWGWGTSWGAAAIDLATKLGLIAPDGKGETAP
jgi:hypothetical protein